MTWLKNHPNVIRAVAVAIFFVIWEVAGRDVSPLFLSPPSRIFSAA